MPEFSTTLEQAIHTSLVEANKRNHTIATTEHFLLVLLEEPTARRALLASGGNIEALRSNLEHYLDYFDTEYISDKAGAKAAASDAFQRIIQRAAIHVQTSGRETIEGHNALIAVFAERESYAAKLLNEQDITRYDVVNFSAHGVAKIPELNEPRPIEEIFLKSDEGQDNKQEGDEEVDELLTEAEWLSKYKNQVEQENLNQVNRFGLSEIRNKSSFCFVSYARTDVAVTSSFIEELEKNGVNIWWDQKISPGQEWRKEISEKLASADAVIVLWTNDSVKSTGVIEEASMAQKHKKLIHLKLDDCELPYGFGETQYVDLSSWDGTDTHENFRKVLFAINDKFSSDAVDYFSTRLKQSSPIDIVVRNGRLSMKDAPANSPPEVNDPRDLDHRLKALRLTLCSLTNMCSDTQAFQLPKTLHHCLALLKQSLETDHLTWYAIEDARDLLCDCMRDNYAKESWNSVIYSGLMGLLKRIDEIKPLLQPKQIYPNWNDPRPPSPEPTIPIEEIENIKDLSSKVVSEFEEDYASGVIDDAIKESIWRASSVIDSIDQEAIDSDRRLFRIRRSLKSIAFVLGGLVSAISAGVMVNLLTAPSAAATFLVRIKPLFDAILGFFS